VCVGRSIVRSHSGAPHPLDPTGLGREHGTSHLPPSSEVEPCVKVADPVVAEAAVEDERLAQRGHRKACGEWRRCCGARRERRGALDRSRSDPEQRQRNDNRVSDVRSQGGLPEAIEATGELWVHLHCAEVYSSFRCLPTGELHPRMAQPSTRQRPGGSLGPGAGPQGFGTLVRYRSIHCET